MNSYFKKQVWIDYRVNNMPIDSIARKYGFSYDVVKKVLFPAGEKITSATLNVRQLSPKEAKTILGLELEKAKLLPIQPKQEKNDGKMKDWEPPKTEEVTTELTKQQLAGKKSWATRKRGRPTNEELALRREKALEELKKEGESITQLVEEPPKERKKYTKKEKGWVHIESPVPEMEEEKEDNTSNRYIIIHLLKQAIILLEEEEDKELTKKVQKMMSKGIKK